MTRIVVTEFVSLDGVMEEPRWTFDFDRGKEGDQFKYEELFDAESLLLGRVTYQGFAAAWPGMGGDDFGQRMNNIHKYVVSLDPDRRRGGLGPYHGAASGDVAAEVAALKAQPGGDLLVEGSAQLVHTLAQHRLVDEYRLMVFPVILGQGKRTFPDSMPAPAKLTITNSRTVGSGVLLLNLTPEQAIS